MRVARVKFLVKDEFEPGDCLNCPLGSYVSSTGNAVCAMGYRSCDCPIELDYNSYAMDEEDITD